MILQIDRDYFIAHTSGAPDTKTVERLYLDGIKYLLDTGEGVFCQKVGENVDLELGEALEPEEGNVEHTKRLVCQLSPKYGDKEYVIVLHGGITAWLLNDEGKTLYRVFSS